MNFFRSVILFILLLTMQNSYADNHDKKNIIDEAKDVTNTSNETQAKVEQNIKDEIEGEDIPLNDPFAGNASIQ